MKKTDLAKYFDGEIEFHTKLHKIATEAMLEAYKDKSIGGVQKWGDVMSQENTVVMTLQNCKQALVVHNK